MRTTTKTPASQNRSVPSCRKNKQQGPPKRLTPTRSQPRRKKVVSTRPTPSRTHTPHQTTHETIVTQSATARADHLLNTHPRTQHDIHQSDILLLFFFLRALRPCVMALCDHRGVATYSLRGDLHIYISYIIYYIISYTSIYVREKHHELYKLVLKLTTATPPTNQTQSADFLKKKRASSSLPVPFW